jgi:hypothetical protein
MLRENSIGVDIRPRRWGRIPGRSSVAAGNRGGQTSDHLWPPWLRATVSAVTPDVFVQPKLPPSLDTLCRLFHPQPRHRSCALRNRWTLPRQRRAWVRGPGARDTAGDVLCADQAAHPYRKPGSPRPSCRQVAAKTLKLLGLPTAAPALAGCRLAFGRLPLRPRCLPNMIVLSNPTLRLGASFRSRREGRFRWPVRERQACSAWHS